MHIEQYDRRSPFQDAEQLNDVNWVNSPSLVQFNSNLAGQCVDNAIPVSSPARRKTISRVAMGLCARSRHSAWPHN